MAVGLLEAAGLIEQYGHEAHKDGVLSTDDLLFAANAKRRIGCKSVRATLLRAERDRLIALGKLVRQWRTEG